MVAIGYWILDNQVRFHNYIIHQNKTGSEDLNLNDWRIVEMFLCKYTLFLSVKIVLPLNRNTEIFQKHWIHL